jgi:hypothetical protein
MSAWERIEGEHGFTIEWRDDAPLVMTIEDDQGTPVDQVSAASFLGLAGTTMAGVMIAALAGAEAEPGKQASGHDALPTVTKEELQRGADYRELLLLRAEAKGREQREKRHDEYEREWKKERAALLLERNQFAVALVVRTEDLDKVRTLVGPQFNKYPSAVSDARLIADELRCKCGSLDCEQHQREAQKCTDECPCEGIKS